MAPFSLSDGADAMSDRLRDFIEASNRTESTADLFEAFSSAIGGYGYDRFLYAMISEDPVHEWHTAPSIMRNYPEDWMKFYVENGFMAIDPLKKIAYQARRAVLWCDVPRQMELDPQQKRCFYGGIEAGLYSGIGVPFHGPYGELAGIGIASSDRRLRTSDTVVRKLEVMSMQFHVAHLALSLPPIAQARARLTPRQREVLLWVAKSKSNWDIGQILGISENTVHFTLKECARRLGTTSRVGSVLKAIRLNLINP